MKWRVSSLWHCTLSYWTISSENCRRLTVEDVWKFVEVMDLMTLKQRSESFRDAIRPLIAFVEKACQSLVGSLVRCSDEHLGRAAKHVSMSSDFVTETSPNTKKILQQRWVFLNILIPIMASLVETFIRQNGNGYFRPSSKIGVSHVKPKKANECQKILDIAISRVLNQLHKSVRFKAEKSEKATDDFLLKSKKFYEPAVSPHISSARNEETQRCWKRIKKIGARQHWSKPIFCSEKSQSVISKDCTNFALRQ